VDNFIVSARKYRPVTFESVVGQQHITNTLKNAIKNNQLAQAFLFCGPRGVGKTTCARILAKTINCENLQSNGEACGVCPSCQSFQNGNSFNVHELDAASNNSVDDIRSLIEQVRIPPQGVRYKIYIIDEVHMLSASAFNAFLKTLEEPPHYAIFILATTEKHKILPTILSRCQIFDFNRIRVEDMANHLASIAGKENISFEPDGLHIIAQKADGGLRDALSMFDQIVSFSGGNVTYRSVIDNLNILDYDYYFNITDSLLTEDNAKVLLFFDEILARGFDGAHFISGLAEHFRNLLVTKDQSTLKLLEVSEGIKTKYLQQSQSASVSFLLSAMNIANQCDLSYKQSKNQRLQVELALLKMCNLQSVFNLVTNPFTTTSAPGESLKKKSDARVAAIKPKEAEAVSMVSEAPLEYNTAKDQP
jgi:DNA polymerase-3 subunit gamma/tau